MADITIDSLRQMFVDMFSSPRGNSAPGTATPGQQSVADAAGNAANVLGPFAKGAGDFLKLMTENLPQVATGLMGVARASDAAKTSLDTMAKFVPGIGSALSNVIGVLDQYRTVGNEANKIGVGQLNTARLQEEAQKAGFNNAQEYIQFLSKTAGNSLKNIAGSNELSSRKFLEFAERVQSQDLVTKLKGQAAISPEEIARIAAVTAGGKTDQLKTDKGREELSIKAAQAANEINRLAQTTGKSREQMIAELEEKQKSARGQLELQNLRNDAERDQYLKTQVAVLGMGKSMQDITTTIFSGGYLDKTARTQLQVATGGRSGQYMRAVRDQRRTANLADDDPGKIAAQKRLDAEIARANAYQSSRQYSNRALTTQDGARKDAYEKFQAENAQKAGQAAEVRDTGLSPAEAARRQRVGYGDALLQGNNQEAIDLPVGAEGKKNAGAVTTQLLNQGYEAARVNAAAATGEIRKFNEELGKAPEGLKPVRKFFEFMFGPLGQTAKQASERMAENTGAIKNKIVPAETEASKAKLEEELKNAKLPRATDGRAHGTLGEIGQVTEPKDIIAKLHKGETVVTPEQLKNLLSGSASNAISDVMKSATTNMPKEGGIDVSKITSGLKEITTTISSVTGGGSTTRSTVENDDAKAAKKELEAVKAQFQTEKNDIRAQVKSNLGADAKPADIMRAMRDNPQAKALEARMQEATAKLSTRISDGTTSKTVTEPNAKSVSIADIQRSMTQGLSQVDAQKKAESQAAKINDFVTPEINRTKINDTASQSVESISNKLSNAKNDKSTAESEEIDYATEEPKFEEQSNKVGLNDLNEQLIQLNTSIRQLIQHSAESVETASKQVKATKSLSGNRFG